MRRHLLYILLILTGLTSLGFSAAITVGFETASSSGSESSTTASLTVKLTSTATGNDTTLTDNVFVSYSEGTGSTANNYPEAYYDFILSSNTLTIFAGTSSNTIDITIVDDGRDEEAETIVCDIAKPFGLDLGTASHTYTITDNDDLPMVTFATTTSTGTEGTLVQLTVNLNQDAGLTVSVPWTFEAGSSTASSADLTPTSGTLSFTEGQNSKTIDFTPIDDTLDEQDETAYIKLGTLTNANFGAITGHQVTITDGDDPPEIAFSSATTSTQNESAGSVTIYVELSTPSGLETSANYSVSGTSTGGGVDHDLGSGVATIAAGDGSTTITFNIVDDALDEDNETIILTLSSPTNSTIGTNDTYTITITDNDSEPFVSFDATAGSGSEDSTPVSIAVSLSAQSGRDAIVNYNITGGTATGSGTDYTFTDGSLTFSAGETSKNLSLIVVDDALDEQAETIIFTLSGASNATLGTNDEYTYTITDNDAAPTIGFSDATSSKTEGDGVVTVTIGLTSLSGYDVSVDYYVSGGTATGSGTDYAITEGTATIPSGSLTATFNVTITDDDLDENSETIILGLQNPVNVSIGGNTTHTMTITDNDDAPTVTFASSTSTDSEAATPVQLTVNLSRSSGLAISVYYSVTGGTTASGSGTDFTLADGTLNFAAGDSSKTIDITIVNDALDENDELIEVTLSNPSNATLGSTIVHTYTLTDDDPKPSVGFKETTASGDEAASPTITAELSAVSGLDITVDYAVTGGTATGAGVDYTLQDGTFTFAAGDQTATTDISVVDDDADEDNETIIIQLSNPSSTTSINTGAQTFTYTIENNDDPPNISFLSGTSTENEDAGTVSLTVTLSAASGRDVSFDYAVSGGDATGSGTDYTFSSGSKTISAGEASTSISITVTDDTIDENDETVIIALSNATNGTIAGNTTHTLTIADNDATPTISFDQLSQSSSEGTAGPTIGLSITAVSGLDISVAYTVADGTAAGSGEDYTLGAGTISIPAGSSTAEIAVTVIDDNTDENDETFTVTLTSGSETNVNLPAAGNRTHTFTIVDNDDPPADFTVGTITTQGGQSVKGYWNNTNTAFTVRVPVANDAALEGGTIQVLAKNTSTNYVSLGSVYTILNGDLGDSATITITDTQFEAHSAYGETKVITISATITDQYGNSTEGTGSSTTLTIDTTDPSSFTVGDLTPRGTIDVSGYWNSTSSTLVVDIPLENDGTLPGGSITVQGRVGSNTDWTDLGTSTGIGQGDPGTTVSITVLRAELETIPDFTSSDGANLYITATITDDAGNSLQGTESNTQIIIDEVSPTITSVASDTDNGYYNKSDQIVLHVITNEDVTVTGQPTLALNSGTTAAATYSSGSGSDTLVFNYTVLDGDSSADLDYKNVNAFDLNNATIRDNAGNTLVLTLPVPGDNGSISQAYDIVIDTQAPTATISFSENPVNASASPTLTVDFNEVMNSSPGLAPRAYILYAKDTELDTTDMTQAGAQTWTLALDIPEGIDGKAMVSIIGTDLALNDLTNGNTTGREILRVDNTDPVLTNITPDSNSYVNHINVTYNLSENVESGTVAYNSVSGTGHPDNHVVTLEANQLKAGSYSETFTIPLVDGTVYNMVWVVTDSAGNQNAQTIEANITYDVTAPTAVITYSDTVANGGTEVTITATFSEAVIAPQIAIDFAGADDLSSTAMTVTTGTDSTKWTYVLTVPSGEGYNGYATIDLNTTDLAENSIGSARISDNDLLRIDNTRPTLTLTYVNQDLPTVSNKGNGGDLVQITAVFSESMDAPTLDIQFGDTLYDNYQNNGAPVSDKEWVYDIVLPTGTANSDTVIVSTDAVDAAGNGITDYTNEDLFVVDNDLPAAFLTGTVSPFGGNVVPKWINGTTDSLQISVPVAAASSDPSMIGGGIALEMFNLTRGTNYIVVGDTNTILAGGTNVITRAVTDIITATGLQTGDSLSTRAILYDIVGNRTVGDTSTSVLTYDPNPPLFGGVPPGTPADSILLSTDDFTMTWLAFTETKPAVESGIDYYEYAMDIEGTNDTTGFSNWSAVPDDTTLTATKQLRHNTKYNFYVRCYDNAGNLSIVAKPDPQLYRLNSAPVITQIDTVAGFEDIAYADTVEVTDADELTYFSDTYKYYATTTRLYGDPAVSQITVDSLNGALSWLPTQADTGTYKIEIIVKDNWGFADTISYGFVVEPVNDSPVLNIAAPDSNITFDEDKPATDSILVNLSQYASDVDDSLHLLSWQIAILADTSTYPRFPAGQVVMTSDTPSSVRTYLSNIYGLPKLSDFKRTKTGLRITKAMASDTLHVVVDSLHVKSWVANNIRWALIYADSNYYTKTGRTIVVSTADPEGLSDTDTIRITIKPENDPPVWSTIGDQFVNENDTLRLDLAEYVTDVDDSLLTFKISAISNPDKMVISQAEYSSSSLGDSIAFIPEQLWSDSARIRVVVLDGASPPNSDTTEFTIDVLFVPRPAISMWVVQNAAFSNYYKIFITDSARKTTSLELRVQNERVTLDTVGTYTYVGNHSFVSAGTYAFNVLAQGIVGTVDTTASVGLAVARANKTWGGASVDGVFGLQGKPGSVRFDQSVMIVDSSMFDPSFFDRASYLIGDESMSFAAPILVSFQTEAKEVAIYRRDIGVSWRELPSMTEDGVVSAYSDRMGYYRLGPKTIFVPGKTSLGNNYPNPFNPYTNIEFDVGFVDGPQQKVTLMVFNIRGQRIATLFNDYITIGRHTVRWDSKDNNGANVASGIYFVRLSSSSGYNKTHKVLLVR